MLTALSVITFTEIFAKNYEYKLGCFHKYHCITIHHSHLKQILNITQIYSKYSLWFLLPE